MKVFTWQHRLLVLSLTLGVVLAFGFLGWLIGSRAGSPEAGIVVAVLLSYPMSLWLVAARMRKSAQKNLSEDVAEPAV